MMREFIIDKNSDGIRLDKFMYGVMPNIKFGEVCKALRKKKVRVNGKHKDGTYRVSNGEHIQIYMNDEFFETNSPIHDFSWKNCPTDTEITSRLTTAAVLRPHTDIAACWRQTWATRLKGDKQ